MSGEVRGRDFWAGMELLQDYKDYLDELTSSLPVLSENDNG